MWLAAQGDVCCGGPSFAGERDTDHKKCSRRALEKEESKQVLLLRRAIINVSAKLERTSKVLHFEAAFLACAPQLSSVYTKQFKGNDE
jgi:hypothetical protein